MIPIKDIPINDQILLDALLGIIEQYMPSGGIADSYTHACMGAGEDASDVLMRYDLADDDGYHIVLNRPRVDALQLSVENHSRG